MSIMDIGLSRFLMQLLVEMSVKPGSSSDVLGILRLPPTPMDPPFDQQLFEFTTLLQETDPERAEVAIELEGATCLTSAKS